MLHLPFESIGRLPAPNDNVAIATQTLPAGTKIERDGSIFTIDYTILVGHRFAVCPIAVGEGLLSWDLPFGLATRPIAPGQYVANAGMIDALNSRTFDPKFAYTFPQEPNFRDRIVPYEVDDATFQPGPPTACYPQERTFLGYDRSASRGVGTRNTIVILGTTSSTASFARALAQRCQPIVADQSNIDGLVPVAHTEGSGYERINNRDFLLRTLAGLIVHPNVGAILAVDLATDTINNQILRQYMHDNDYPLSDVAHHFYSLSQNFSEDLANCERLLRGWLPSVNSVQRTPQSLRHLSIALQCGGSDAFSGISGNPLAASVAKEVIGYGGRANLAETDELIGSEAYVLQNVAALDLARKFLNYIAEFKERLAWHGQSAEGNPSGGNKYRGLYNIALKSIGAAAKRHPDVRLDHVVDYGERMQAPGYYFMNTPGNDLESIAGQVAGGSNLIIFITGNGSITNFPFVPTIKIMTTTQRYELLANEMDVNAGAYLDGTTMRDLTTETLDLLINIASGQPSKGELAAHSQISIWRNWQQRDRSRLPLILEREKPNGKPIALAPRTPHLLNTRLSCHHSSRGKIGLIIPTSLCSGQIARMAADQLNNAQINIAQVNNEHANPLTRFAALVHTEGCGVAFASTREVYAETMVGYAVHRLVGACLFLEHGCEKAHNDYLHSLLLERDLAEDDFGWASVQLDGGIEKVLEKIGQYFQPENVLGHSDTYKPSQVLTAAFIIEGDLPDVVAQTLAQAAVAIVAAGGSVVIATGTLSQSTHFLNALGLHEEPTPSLAYGQSIVEPGFHIMERPTPHWTETLTGVGATGAEIIIAFTHNPRPGHPFIPLLHLSDRANDSAADLVLASDADLWIEQIIVAVEQIVCGELMPKSFANHNIDFQLTRGWLGIST